MRVIIVIQRRHEPGAAPGLRRGVLAPWSEHLRGLEPADRRYEFTADEMRECHKSR